MVGGGGVKLRFLLDQNVDADCISALVNLGHDAWTAGQAGHAQTLDGDLAVYAHDQDAILVTHDRELVRARRKLPIGQFILLSCAPWEAPALLTRLLPGITTELTRVDNLIVSLSVHADGSDHITRTYGTERR